MNAETLTTPCIIMPEFNKEYYSLFSVSTISNLILSVLLFSIFLSVFYFTYVAKVEGDIVEEQINETISDLMGDFKNLNFNTDLIKASMGNLQLPDMLEEDEKVKENNKLLLNKVIKIIFIASLCVVFVLSCFLLFTSLTLKDLLKVVGLNLVLLLFVFVTEMIFIHGVTKNYRMLDPNYVKKTFIENILALKHLN